MTVSFPSIELGRGRSGMEINARGKGLTQKITGPIWKCYFRTHMMPKNNGIFKEFRTLTLFNLGLCSLPDAFLQVPLYVPDSSQENCWSPQSVPASVLRCLCDSEAESLTAPMEGGVKKMKRKITENLPRITSSGVKIGKGDQKRRRQMYENGCKLFHTIW